MKTPFILLVLTSSLNFHYCALASWAEADGAAASDKPKEGSSVNPEAKGIEQKKDTGSSDGTKKETDAKEPVPQKEPAREPVKEPAREPVKEPTREPVKEPAKEPAKSEPDNKEPDKKEASAGSASTPGMSPALILVLQNYAYRKQGNYQAAENALQDALKIVKTDADKVKVYNAFGGLYMQAGKDKESESYLRQAVELAQKLLPADSTELASYLDNLSVSCGNNKKFADAYSFNKRAGEIYKAHLNEPNATLDLIKVLDNRGGILLTENKLAEAEKTYEEAIDLAKNYKNTPPELLACMEDNLGGVFAMEGELVKSEESRVNALSLLESSLGFTHPDTIKTQKNLAFVYAQQGKYKEASDLLKSAIEKLKGSGNVNSRLLQSCMSDLNAVQQLMNASTAKLSPVQTEIMKGFMALKNGSIEQSKKIFDDVIKAHPKEGDAYAGRAVVFRRKHESESELADLNKAIELSPTTPSYYFARGEVQVERKNHIAAIPDFKKCVELDKTKRIAIANFLLGACYVETHKPTEGLPYLNAYIASTPKDAQGYLVRAAAYKMLGNEEEFKIDVKHAQELSGR